MSPYHPSCASLFRLRAWFGLIATVVLSGTALAQSWNLPASPVTGTYYGISFTTAASNHGNTITIYVQAPGSSTWNGHGGGGGSPTAPITASGGITFSTVGTWTFKAVNGSSSGSTTLSTTTRTVTASSTAVSFSFANLSHTYDGNTKTASVSPDPANATYTADLTKGPGVGSYTVTATGTGSFTGSGSATLTINASGQSFVDISPGSGSVSTGQSLAFTASGGSGSGAYVWGGDASGSGGSQSVTFNTAGTRYVTVYRQGDGSYAQSNTATATISVSVPDTTPPNPPPNPQVSSLTASSFVLSWSAPSGEAATGYRVRLGSGSFTEIGNVLSHTFTGLSAGTAYTAQVQARNAAGNWSSSASYGATTSGGGGSGGSASMVFWMDTNSDGILDRVTGSNSPQFYFYIDSWTTTNVPYASSPLNSWMATLTNFFSGTPYDNYSRVWQPEVGFWYGFTTHFSVNFRVETEADRPQKIYVDYSRLADINRARWYQLLNLPGFSTGGWHNVYHSITDPGLFDRAQYFLVEEGKPVGSVQFKDSAGNALTGSVAVNGTANLFLPANNQVALNLFNSSGGMIGAAHQVAWQIRDTIGNILRQGLGLNVDFDNLDLGQIAQLVIILDNATNKSVNVSAKSVLVKKVEFLGAFSNLTGYNSDFAGSGGEILNPKGWALNGANNPVAHVKGVAPTVRVTLVAKPANKTFTLNGFSQMLGLNFQSSSQTSTGTDQVVDISSTTSFPSMTGILDGYIGWDITLDGQFRQANPSGDPHTVFLTWGSIPGSGVTRKRLSWTAGVTNGANSPQAIATLLHNHMVNNVSLGGSNYSGWALLDPNTSGNCDQIAMTMENAFEIIGAGNATLRRIKASNVPGAGNCLLSSPTALQQRVASDGTPEYLVLYFPLASPTYRYNSFEGCCEAAGTYYAMGLGQGVVVTASNDYEMLKALRDSPNVQAQQHWIRTIGNQNPGSGGQFSEFIAVEPIP